MSEQKDNNYASILAPAGVRLMVCPEARACSHTYGCEHNHPHNKNADCTAVGSRCMNPCVPVAPSSGVPDVPREERSCDNCGHVKKDSLKDCHCEADCDHASLWIPSKPAPASKFAPFEPPFRYDEKSGWIVDKHDFKTIPVSFHQSCMWMFERHTAEEMLSTKNRIGHAVAAAMNKESK